MRQDVRSKGGLKKLGRSILVFDFHPAGATTATSSPNTSGRSAPVRDAAAETAAEPTAVEGAIAAAGEAGGSVGGSGEGQAAAEGAGGRNGASSGCVVFVHDRVGVRSFVACTR